MEVIDKLIIDNNHSLEWGASTWDEDDFSIRNPLARIYSPCPQKEKTINTIMLYKITEIIF
ncbi:MAG: hypothetical protein H7250_12305 [Flavobacterium sp.]|nr:hypothetical protein [Flavobacterium sp.]